MKVFFLGAYSDQGMSGLMESSYDARVKAISKMCEKAGAKLGSVTYLQGDYDVIADVEVDCVETASGLGAMMRLSGGWDELLVMPEFDVDKAIAASKAAGGYSIPGQE